MPGQHRESPMKRDGRVALVVGGGSGLGRAMAQELARLGMTVMAAGVASPVEMAPGDLDVLDAYVQIDLRDDRRTGVTIDDLINRHSRIDILIMNAARRDLRLLDEFEDQAIRDAMAVNLTAHVAVVRRILPVMLGNGYGRIVFISSQSGLWAYPRGSVYCAGKAGLLRFGEALGRQLIGSDADVTANVVCPGAFGFPAHRDPESAVQYTPRVRAIIDEVLRLIDGSACGEVVPVLSVRERLIWIVEDLVRHSRAMGRVYRTWRFGRGARR